MMKNTINVLLCLLALALSGCGFNLVNSTARGLTPVLKWHLDKGKDVNYRDNKGRTLLMIAAEKNKLENVKLLVERGADLNAQDFDGNTALMKSVACQHDSSAVVRIRTCFLRQRVCQSSACVSMPI